MSMTPSRRAVEAMTLGGMALDNRAIIVRCYPCKKTRTFLCADLAKVYGEKRSPHTLFEHCAKCGAPTRRDFGFPKRGETIRRPVEISKWHWLDSVYDPDETGGANAS
jgi:hypothetical protein